MRSIDQTSENRVMNLAHHALERWASLPQRQIEVFAQSPRSLLTVTWAASTENGTVCCSWKLYTCSRLTSRPLLASYSFFQAATELLCFQATFQSPLLKPPHTSVSPFRRTSIQCGLSLRKFLFEFTGQLVHIRRFTKRPDLLFGGVYIHAHLLAEFLQHLKNRSQLLFRKHADLKIEMRTTVGLTGHSVLTD